MISFDGYCILNFLLLLLFLCTVFLVRTAVKTENEKWRYCNIKTDKKETCSLSLMASWSNRNLLSLLLHIKPRKTGTMQKEHHSLRQNWQEDTALFIHLMIFSFFSRWVKIEWVTICTCYNRKYSHFYTSFWLCSAKKSVGLQILQKKKRLLISFQITSPPSY